MRGHWESDIDISAAPSTIHPSLSPQEQTALKFVFSRLCGCPCQGNLFLQLWLVGVYMSDVLLCLCCCLATRVFQTHTVCTAYTKSVTTKMTVWYVRSFHGFIKQVLRTLYFTIPNHFCLGYPGFSSYRSLPSPKRGLLWRGVTSYKIVPYFPPPPPKPICCLPAPHPPEAT